MLKILIPKILGTLGKALFNRFFAKFILRKIVKRSDNLLDDNGLEMILAAIDGDAERAMSFGMKAISELEKIIDKK